MSNNPLLERLEGLRPRFEEVSTLITDPAVIGDRQRYVKLTREYRELQRLMDATDRYRSAQWRRRKNSCKARRTKKCARWRVRKWPTPKSKSPMQNRR
jgi:protein subunit release factor A